MTTARALTTSAVNPAVAEAMEVYQRLEVVRNVLAPDLNDQELSLFALVANRSGLDPFAKQIYAVKRGGRVTFQTGIDGYRSIAERTGQYGGSDEPEFGDIKNGHPEWARVTVYRYRNGERIPQSATAYWDEFFPGGNQAAMWTKMPRNQLAKCAEALALRKAFPSWFADVYTDAEMDQAGRPENPALTVAAAAATPRERLAARRAALEEPVAEPVAEPEPDAEDAEDMDLRDVAEAVFAEEPEPVKGKADPVRCDAASPYEDGSGTCAREQGHPGNHKNHDRESW